MTRQDDRYFHARAEAEIAAAAKTDKPEACQAHYQMAEAYLAKVYPAEAVDDAS